MAAFSLAMFVMVRLHGERDRHVEQEPFVAQPVMETPHFAEVDPRYEPQQLELDLEAESTPS